MKPNSNTDSWAHQPRPSLSWPRALKSDHKPPGSGLRSSPASNPQEATRTSLSRSQPGRRRQQIFTSYSLLTNRPRLRAPQFSWPNANKYHIPPPPNTFRPLLVTHLRLSASTKLCGPTSQPKVAHHLPTPLDISSHQIGGPYLRKDFLSSFTPRTRAGLQRSEQAATVTGLLPDQPF